MKSFLFHQVAEYNKMKRQKGRHADVDDDVADVEETNPMWLKDKGLEIIHYRVVPRSMLIKVHVLAIGILGEFGTSFVVQLFRR